MELPFDPVILFMGILASSLMPTFSALISGLKTSNDYIIWSTCPLMDFELVTYLSSRFPPRHRALALNSSSG